MKLVVSTLCLCVSGVVFHTRCYFRGNSVGFLWGYSEMARNRCSLNRMDSTLFYISFCTRGSEVLLYVKLW